jgi:pimeloyl-ACP methyl ester carboxylesterase
MIHGLGGQMRNFSHGLLDRLATDHRVILIDRPGSGYSQAIGVNNVRAQAAVIAKLLERLDVERPLVVGHSLGGAVALALALDHPALVGGLALIAPLTQMIEEVPPAFRGLAIRSAALRRAAAWTIATPATLLAAAKGRDLVFAPDPVPTDFDTRGGGALVTRPGTFESASADMVAANVDLPEMMQRYPTLTMPLGILYGRGDQILDPALHGERLAAAVPGTDLTLMEGGHMIPITKPDEVAAWIRERSRRAPA